MQPLVENAILHGLRARTSGGHIRVSIRKRGSGAVIYVTDNGCGFDTKVRSAGGKHNSVSLDNIAERMALNNGRLDLFSILGLGTCARIIIERDETI